MVLANQNAKLTGTDQGFLVLILVLTQKPWERGWAMNYLAFILEASSVLLWVYRLPVKTSLCQNVPGQNVPRSKRPQVKISIGQNVLKFAMF